MNLIRFTVKTHFSADFKYRELEKAAPKIELTYDDITEEGIHQKKQHPQQRRKKRKVKLTLGVVSKLSQLARKQTALNLGGRLE